MTIPLLSRGDTIAIVAPAKAIEASLVLEAKSLFESKGFKVKVSANCTGEYNYFSGTIEQRLLDFQSAIDDPEVKAILCARGGYGSVQIVDKLDWNRFNSHPKWVIGFSDITVFHHKINTMGYPSIHGTMPLNFADNTAESISTLLEAISKPSYSIVTDKTQSNITGSASGTLVGGNLSIVYSLLGTDDHLNYTDTILFIEEVGEHIYAIDRMFHAFKKARILSKIKGLIVGGMTQIKDTEQPFGKTLEEVIHYHFGNLHIPVTFGFPAGHVDDNRALRLGSKVHLEVGNTVSLDFSTVQ